MARYIMDEMTIAGSKWLGQGAVSLRNLAPLETVGWLSKGAGTVKAKTITAVLADPADTQEQEELMAALERFIRRSLQKCNFNFTQTTRDQFVLLQGDELLIIHHSLGGGCTLLTKTK